MSRVITASEKQELYDLKQQQAVLTLIKNESTVYHSSKQAPELYIVDDITFEEAE